MLTMIRSSYSTGKGKTQSIESCRQNCFIVRGFELHFKKEL